MDDKKQEFSYYIKSKNPDVGMICAFDPTCREVEDLIFFGTFIYCDGEFEVKRDLYPELYEFLCSKGMSSVPTQAKAERIFKHRLIPPRVFTEDSGNGMQLNPDYYRCFAIEPIDYIKKNNLGFFQGNVIKYVTRYNKKYPANFSGRIADLKKAISNLEKLIEQEKERGGS